MPVCRSPRSESTGVSANVEGSHDSGLGPTDSSRSKVQGALQLGRTRPPRAAKPYELIVVRCNRIHRPPTQARVPPMEIEDKPTRFDPQYRPSWHIDDAIVRLRL
jgi:hypothetical protein